MFDDPSLWLVLGSMAGTASLLSLWFDRRREDAGPDDWLSSQLD